MSVLQERFGKLKASLFSHGYEVAGEIEVLFKQQIVDCFFSPQKLQVSKYKQHLNIRILKYIVNI